MKGFVLGVVVTLGVGAAIGAAVVYSGRIDVAADTPHSAATFRLIEIARDKAIDRQARGVSVPADLADDERIRRGAGNYAAMCVECHLAPGKTSSEIRRGLYPEPPDLSREAEPNEAAKQFWVIKHGIKASGMPAWSKGGIEDAAIWDMVAFLQKMPTLDAAQYTALVAASDGHSHGGLDTDAPHHDEADPAPIDMPASAAPPKKKPHDPNDGHAH
ncbi:MAG: cytochrome c [Thiobacillus sp.]|nr:cytochrome c [Thiobacillus sp.]